LLNSISSCFWDIGLLLGHKPWPFMHTWHHRWRHR